MNLKNYIIKEFIEFKRYIHNFIPDKLFLSMVYRSKFGKKLNWDNPKTFNEKLQWLKLYDRRPEYTTYVDKYAVREYIAKTIGEEYLIPLLGVWNTPDEIDFDKLPNQFVLKCNHDSGGLVICKDKSKLNIEETKAKLNKCLKRDYYLSSREWPYKNVPRKIIAEKYMVDESGYELKDYKIFNFNGEPKFIQIDFNRFVNHLRNLCTIDWKQMKVNFSYANDFSKNIEKPESLEEMLSLALKLSDKIPFVRTDFYHINGKIYFGEMTFYPEAGFGKFKPEKWDYIFGSWLSLPSSSKDRKFGGMK